MRIAAALALMALALGVSAGAPSSVAEAGQTVALRTGFNPYRLGAPTTIEFEFEVTSTTPGAVPEPVTGVDLKLPAGLALATSTLGLANCEAAKLLTQGLEGCPPNARVGFGSAIAAIPIDGGAVQEEGQLTALIGPPNPEHLEVLFFAEAERPVSAELVFPGEILEGGGPFSAELNTEVPLIPTWPGGPNISITKMASTIGPLRLTYYRNVDGQVMAFRPRGASLPKRCPRHGFPFHIELTFLDGTKAGAASAVPCPKRQPFRSRRP
jgi:hypothetical protein